MTKRIPHLFKKIAAITIVSFGVTTLPQIMPQMMVSTAMAEDTMQAKWVGDVPIMPQLNIEKNLGFAFDSPEGRIVTIYLSGEVGDSDVQAYYNVAMPPLGWTQKNAMNWQREGDHLAIVATTTSAQKLWKITIRPE